MTISMTGNEVAEAIEIAVIVGSIVAMLVAALVVYLMVRPPRRSRVQARSEPDTLDVEEMLALIDRMERRLDVLERAVVADEAKPGNKLLETGEGPDMRRTK